MLKSIRLARTAHAALLVAFASAAAGVAGCSVVLDFSTPLPDGAVADGGVETSAETAGDSAVDSRVDEGIDSEIDSTVTETATDSGTDTAETAVDSATDSGVDSAMDSGVDSATDSGTDTEMDSGIDTGIDSGTDTEMDSGTDTELPDLGAETLDAPEIGLDADETSLDAADAEGDADEVDGDAAEVDTAPMCTVPGDCPGMDTECMARTCTAGVCGFSFQPDGTRIMAQTAGDCRAVVCNGAGATRSANDNMDVPNDGRQCTRDVCTDGVATNPSSPAGAPCTEGTGRVCDGAGTCVQCNATTDCPSGETCNTTTHTCVGPSCTDTVKNGTETDIDCGGSCSTKCALGQMCGAGTDCTSTHCVGSRCVECTSGTECMSGVCTGNSCATATCSDSVKNGTESDVDCGGTCSTKCALGKVCGAGTDCTSTHCVGSRCVECTSGTECMSGVCSGNSCATATCSDSVKNGTETDVDCGGSCAPCAAGKACAGGSDCTSGVCTGSVCAAAGCTDMVKNGTETDVDCGGTVCSAKCDNGKICGVNADCTSTHCDGGVCVQCVTGTDCPSGVCNTSTKTCAAATCSDTVKNGSETDVDCGGSCTKDCEVGQACATGADCETGICTSSVCAAPSVMSTTPADGASAVPFDTKVRVTFAGPMDGTTLTTQTSTGPCTGSVQLSSDDFATCYGLTGFTLSTDNTVADWTPTPALSYGQTYKIRVTTAAKDGSGNALAMAYQSTTGFTTVVPACTSDVVISQVYGGGGNAGSTYRRDFIELHNRGTTTVNVTGWSVQYASATGSFPSATTGTMTVLSGTIPAGGYFLVAQAAGSGGTTDLPTPDNTGTIPMGGSDGKVALVANSTPLNTPCPASSAVVDLVGYGGTTCAESASTAPLSGVNSARRKSDGCLDTNNNSTDFEVVPAAPRNSATTPVTCSTCTTRNETGVASEADYCVIQFPKNDQTATTGMASPIIYGQIYEMGVTEDPGIPSSVTAQIGYGPDGINPSTQSGWTWTPATYNKQDVNNDEYQGTVTVPTAGTYRYGYRFSLDGGATWTYCDTDGAGSNTGLTFSPANLPRLTVSP